MGRLSGWAKCNPKYLYKKEEERHLNTEEEDDTRAEGNVMWDHKPRSEGSLQKLKKARKQVLPCGHQKQPSLETLRF